MYKAARAVLLREQGYVNVWHISSHSPVCARARVQQNQGVALPFTALLKASRPVLIEGVLHSDGVDTTNLFGAVQHVENLEPLEHLQQLWLGRNRIAEVTGGFDTLTGLRQLSLQANRLESISGLEALTALEELYLSQNGIQCISGLESLSLLKVLDLAYNPITKVCMPTLTASQSCRHANARTRIGWYTKMAALSFSFRKQPTVYTVSDASSSLAMLPSMPCTVRARVQVEGLDQQALLTDLWLNDTQVADLDHLESALSACMHTLEVVYLANSPAAASTQAYLLFMKALLPKLEYLDSTPVAR